MVEGSVLFADQLWPLSGMDVTVTATVTNLGCAVTSTGELFSLKAYFSPDATLDVYDTEVALTRDPRRDREVRTIMNRQVVRVDGLKGVYPCLSSYSTAAGRGQRGDSHTHGLLKVG